MKRIIFTLIIFAILATTNGQVTRSSAYLIQDGTTNFGIQLWPGSIVTDRATNKTYLITEAAAANQTLETTTGKVEITGDGINVWDEGALTVSGASSLNFTGAGVTVSDAGSDIALINIPTSSSGGGGNGFLTNTVSVGDFSPDNTCSANASPAFEAAFATNKDVVFIPKGCYLITSTLTVPYGKTLVFEQGAKLDITGNLTGNQTNLIAGNFQIFTPRSVLSGSFVNKNVLVSWFGAVGDGTTNDHDALTAFFNFISSQQIKGSFIPNRTYYTNRPVGVSVGKIFEFDGRQSKMVMDYADFREDFEEIIGFYGQSVLTKSLVEDAKKDAFQIKLDSYDGLKIGMGLRMTGGFWIAGSASYDKGMLNKVIDTIGDGWVLLETAIPYDFSKSNVTNVRFYDMQSVVVSNLVLEPVGTPSNAISLYNIEAMNLFNATFRNITINQPFYMAFRTRSFYNSTFDNIIINYSHKDPFGGNYGFSYELLVNCIVKNSTFDQYSTCTTSAKYGSYLLTFDNCLFSSPDPSSGGWAFDSHGDLEVKVQNSIIYGVGVGFGRFTFFNCDLWPQATLNKIIHLRYGGFNGMTDITVSNCRVYGDDNSIFLSTIGNENQNNQYSIVNNTFYNEKFLYLTGTNRNYFNNRVVVGDSLQYNLMNTPNYQLNNKTYYENFASGNIELDYDAASLPEISIIIRAKLNEDAARSTDYSFYGTNDGILYLARLRVGSSTVKIELRARNQDGAYLSGTTPDLENDFRDWHVFAFTLGLDQIAIYVDGQPAFIGLRDTTNFKSLFSYSGTNPKFKIGASGASSFPFDGKISDFLLFEKNLSSLEVNKYSEELSYGFEDATIALLSENAHPKIWYDASQNSIDGTIPDGVEIRSIQKSVYADDIEVANRAATNILNLLPTTAPSNPIVGDMYHSSADGLVYIYTESGWEELRTR